jgi:phenylpropionate dioxygenase-like ring-hydroxylating dioxygenase large terminal subunit
MALLADDRTVAQRLLDHVAAGTTDLAPSTWREPVAHYLSPERLAAEMALLGRRPLVFCPSAALPEAGSTYARSTAGVALVAVRGRDGVARVFRNACRHRGAGVAPCGASHAGGSLVCPYHGWTYGLDGTLRHVPHRHGFPDVVDEDRGLVPVRSTERHGLVVVDLSPGPGDRPDTALTLDPDWDEVAGVVTGDHALAGAGESVEPVNWKVMAETFLEGLHIRFLHRETFFPLQYDNVTVVEAFGPHSRIAFPYRALARLADVPPAERSVDRRLTYVYHLFPHAMVATFPGRVLVFVLEPLAVDRTRVLTYGLVVPPGGGAGHPGLPAGDPAAAAPSDRRRRNDDLVAEGGAEDFAVARSVQRGLSGGANEYLEFGLFEGAIAHFHRTLDAALDAWPQPSP